MPKITQKASGTQAGQTVYGDVIFNEATQEYLPNQRPRRAEHFTDRQTELADLLADLQPGRVVTLCGPGGIGKTALAAEAVCHPDTLARFPDGLLFHSFYNQPQAVIALEQIALSYGEEPKPTPQAAAQRALNGRRALLVLDGTEDADNLPAVLAVAGGCGVLVTSRSTEDAPQQWQDIRPLPQPEAIALLQKWAGAYGAEEEPAGQICQLVGGLPLAIRLVGRYLAQRRQPAARYLTWLQESPLKVLNQGQRRLQSVPLLLARSLAQVTDQARQALAVIGQLALAPFDSQPIAAACQWAEFDTEQALGDLLNVGLLTVVETGDLPGYEVSHALIHTYASERLPPDEAPFNRLADYYNQLARAESQQGVAGYRRLDQHRRHISRLIQAGTTRQAWGRVRQLVWAIGYYEQALSIAREIGDRRGEGNRLGNLGNAYRDLGQVSEAIGYYEPALSIAREIGDRRGEGSSLGNLGIAYHQLGQVSEAIGYYEQALSIAREIGDRNQEAGLLVTNALMESAHNENDHLALTMLDNAYSIFTETQNSAGLTTTQRRRGMGTSQR